MTKAAYSVARGVQPVAGPTVRRTERRYELLAKDFTSVEQAVPVRLVYGRARVAGVQITPIFGFRNEAIEGETGKGAK